MKKLLQNKLFQITLIIIIWRIVVLVVPLTIASQIGKNLQPDLENWNRWDTPHYLYIAKNGYTSRGDPANFIVFQPLYPIIVRILNVFLDNLTLTAIITSNIFFIMGILIFYILVKEIYGEEVSRKACIFLNIFPTTYFFSIGYTESLFFFLLVLSFYLVRKNKLIQGGLVGSLTFLTRTMGIMLLPTLILSTITGKKSKLPKTLQIFLISAAFLLTISIYFAINWLVFKDIFAFKTILQNHWYKQFAPPWVSIQNSLKLIPKQLDLNSYIFSYFEGIPAILGVLLIPLAVKKLKSIDWVFYSLSILFVTSTNFLLSTPRYFLSIPPLFILLGILTKKTLIFYTLTVIFLSLLIYFSTLFVQGQWAF